MNDATLLDDLDQQSQPQPTAAQRTAPIDRRAKELVGNVGRILWQQREDEAEAEGDDGLAFIAALMTGEVIKGRTPKGERLLIDTPYRFLGRWDTHPKHGDQFSVSTYVRHTPSSEKGTIAYLVRFAKHVGTKTAMELWKLYGGEAIATLRENPSKVCCDGIMSNRHAIEASRALKEIEDPHELTKVELFGLFERRGFPLEKLIARAILAWGARAPERIRRDPLSLLVRRFPGAGFKRCDKMLCELAPERRNSLKRQTYAALYALRENREGHTWHRVEAIANELRRHVGEGADAGRAFRLGIRGGLFVVRRDPSPEADQRTLWITEARYALNEQRVADQIRMLSSAPNRWPKVSSTELSPHQLEKLAEATAGPVGILAGTPGTGKTFTSAELIRSLRAAGISDSRIAICAPTGKAAVRCTQALAARGVAIEAKTIHRTLEVMRNGHDGEGWKFSRTMGNPLDAQFLIVDESSMLETDLAAALLSACSPGTHVLFVGDPYQLPPVSHGAPLRDMIAARVPCGELTEIRRNAGQIVRACREIKDGNAFEACTNGADGLDPKAGANLAVIATDSAEASIDQLVRRLKGMWAKLGREPIWECQVIVAVNEKSELSRKPLNRLLQAELNPSGRSLPGHPFRLGDKIICLRNSIMSVVRAGGVGSVDTDASSYRPTQQEVFIANGEMCQVKAISHGLTVARALTSDVLIKIPMKKAKAAKEEKQQSGADESADNGNASEDDNAGNSWSGGSLAGAGCNFDLAYACTCHKLQGSEAPVVIVMIDEHSGAKQVASREWWYTAISRASAACILIGQRSTVEKQIKRQQLVRRKTFLSELLQARS